MKKFLKVIGYGVLGFICLGIAIAMFSGGEDTTETTTAPKQEVKKEEPKKVVDQKISQANFDKIKQGDTLSGEGGMTIEEVTEILGKPDSEIESQVGDMKMKDLTWTNLKFESITVSFINGKVSSKAYLK